MSTELSSPSCLGRLGISETLRRFVAEMPYERAPILDFVMEIASGVIPETKVLDLGAGNAPYRELFSHAHYLTSDWANSPHSGADHADIVAPASDLPVESSTIGLVLCTQVLEHVADPLQVLCESLRILRPRGKIALTVPLTWQLHELPHDYYRYTPSGIDYLLKTAGFINVNIRARNDSFTTLAQLMLNVGAMMGQAPDGLDPRRAEVQDLLNSTASHIARLAPLDVDRLLPLGYAVTGDCP